MMNPYHVDLIKTILHEHYAELLREAQSERQFRELNNANKKIGKWPWGIRQFMPKYNVLWPSAG